MEYWKDIKGYEGCYSVSNEGRVKSLSRVLCDGRKIKEKLMKLRSSKDGYIRVKLNKNKQQKTFYLHRLVCSTFKSESNLDVNHIDGDKTNNCLENLEYLTRSENHKHAYKLGLKKVSESMKNKIRRNLDKTHIQQQKKVIHINTGEVFNSIKSAAKSIGIAPNSLSRNLRLGRKNTGLEYFK